MARVKVKKPVEVFTRAYKVALFNAIEEEHGLQDLTPEERALPFMEQPIPERSNVYRSILGDQEDFRVLGRVIHVGNIHLETPYRIYRLTNPPEPMYRLENCTEQALEAMEDGVAYLISQRGNHYQAPINRYAVGRAEAQGGLAMNRKVWAYVHWADDNPQVVGFKVEKPPQERLTVKGKTDVSVF